jgi:hypothetical protein
MLKEICISVTWGEQAKALCPLALDDQFLVDGEWLVSTRGEIIQHCPEGGYPDGVAYVSAALCEEETRKQFYRTIYYEIDTIKSGGVTFYTWVNDVSYQAKFTEPISKEKVVAKQYVDATNIAIQALNAAVKKYGIKTCLTKEDVDEILEGTKEEEK